MGSKDVFGKIISHKDQELKNLLPICLINKNTKLKKSIKKDSLITLDDVILDESEIILSFARSKKDLAYSLTFYNNSYRI